MGSSASKIGIDSIPAVNDKITELVFRPPKTDLRLFKLLDNGKDTFLVTVKSKNNINISTLITTPEKVTSKYILFSHGNGSDIVTMLPYLKYLTEKLNINVVCYDYPGYGLTNGTPSEQSCCDTLDAVATYVLGICKNPQNLTLIGQSLGTGVVIDYAAKNKWKEPIILISPYKSIPSIVYESSFETMIAHNRFCSMDKIKNLVCPVKIFHGEKDKMINISHAKYLFDNLKNQSLLPVWISYAGHNDILNFIKYADLLEVIKN